MKPIFVILVKYVQTLERVDAALEAHRAFLDKYFGLKKIFCAGRQNPRVGGVILCQAETREEAWSIVKEDPFYIQGIAEYDITEFLPARWSELQR